MKKDEVYLQHIVDAITNIEDFIAGIEKNGFLKNKLVQSAIIRQLEIIGEAVKNISPLLKKTHGNIPWKDIAGLRDKLIHQYFGVDIQLVWIICVRDIPVFKEHIVKIIQEIERMDKNE